MTTDSKPHGAPHAGDHLLSPDRRWYWDGPRQTWLPVEGARAHPLADDFRDFTPQHAPQAPSPESQLSRGLSSWVGTMTSEDLSYGQTVLVWARWILIGTGLLLSFWSPADLLTLQVQLAAIIALAFGNFYLHVKLLRGQPAIDNIVYAASLADICVVTALVIVQGGFASPVFIFYFAAVVGISVAFPTRLTAAYATLVVGVYGLICLITADPSDHPAVFTRLIMIAAIAVCGNLFARNESRRRSDAIRIHQEQLGENKQSSASASATQPIQTA
jgi:hypothetical protein